jgi:hypothetical protein
VRFDLAASSENRCSLVDYVRDPLETEMLESWNGVQELIAEGAEEKFGKGTAEFLREADRRQKYMRAELFRRYGLEKITGEADELLDTNAEEEENHQQKDQPM